MNYVYILLCRNGAYYTGYTTDLLRRYQEHVSGTAKCKYTRSFKPVSIAQYWQVKDKTMAMKIERHVKKMAKQQKAQLILNPELLVSDFPDAAEYLKARTDLTPVTEKNK